MPDGTVRLMCPDCAVSLVASMDVESIVLTGSPRIEVRARGSVEHTCRREDVARAQAVTWPPRPGAGQVTGL